MSARIEWESRGKTIEKLIRELKSFSDQSLKVELSFDGGQTTRPISLVGKMSGKCVLLYLEASGPGAVGDEHDLVKTD